MNNETPWIHQRWDQENATMTFTVVKEKRDISADLAICNAATPGPWKWCGDKWGDIVVYSPEQRGFHNNGGEIAELERTRAEDARFIAEARVGWPEAIRRAIDAEAEIERLKAEVTSLNDIGRAYSDRSVRLYEALRGLVSTINRGDSHPTAELQRARVVLQMNPEQ